MEERDFAREEKINALTHGAGALASLVAGGMLLRLAIDSGDGWTIFGVALYGFSLFLLYSASTVYHAVSHAVYKRRLRVLDHCAIFVLIAGTYTPFALSALRGPWGWSAFVLVWLLALIGVIFKILYIRRLQRFSTPLYLAMGWMGVVTLNPLLQTEPLSTVMLLLAGGLTYTAGTFFFHRNDIPFSHAIWHLFVLGGSAFHFLAVLAHLA